MKKRENIKKNSLIGAILVACFGLIYLQTGFSMDLFYFSFLTAGLVAIFFFDAFEGIIPDAISLPLILFTLLFAVLRGVDLVSVGWGMLLGGGVFLMQYLLSRGRWIGSGDIRLGILMGAILGFPLIWIALLMAYSTGAVFACILIATGKKTASSRIPFGTFLTSATLVTMLYGEWIMKTVLKWFS